jgi:hypothetical protein
MKFLTSAVLVSVFLVSSTALAETPQHNKKYSLAASVGYTFGNTALSTNFGIKGGINLNDDLYAGLSYTFFSANSNFPNSITGLYWSSLHFLTADFGHRFRPVPEFEVKPYMGFGFYGLARTGMSFPGLEYNFLYTSGLEATYTFNSVAYLGLDTRLSGGPIGFMGLVNGLIGLRF